MYEVRSAILSLAKDGGISELASDVNVHGEFHTEEAANKLLNDITDSMGLTEMAPGFWSHEKGRIAMLATGGTAGLTYWVEYEPNT